MGVQAERTRMEDDTVMFLFRDGANAWEAKDYLVEQERVEEVQLEQQTYKGKFAEHKEVPKEKKGKKKEKKDKNKKKERLQLRRLNYEKTILKLRNIKVVLSVINLVILLILFIHLYFYACVLHHRAENNYGSKR